MTDTTDTDTGAGDAPKETGSGLRKQLEASLAREKAMRTQILDGAYKDIGLDPTTGLGKAIAEKYEGEASRESLEAFAKDNYGHVAPDPVTPNPVADQINEGQAALDSAGETAGSVIPPTQAELLAKAEAEGDTATSMAIKGNQVAAMMNPQAGR